MSCKVRGCSNSLFGQLKDSGLCLDHFLAEVEECTRNFTLQLQDPSAQEALPQAALKFAMLTAAKLASIGVQNPPAEQPLPGQLLNALLMLVDLRDRLERRAKA